MIAVGTTKKAKQFKKYFTSNGYLKNKYRQRSDGGFGNSKAERFRYMQAANLANSTLVDTLSRPAEAFSPNLTPDLLSALSGPGSSCGLGELAETRPPDASPAAAAPLADAPSQLPAAASDLAATALVGPTCAGACEGEAPIDPAASARPPPTAADPSGAPSDLAPGDDATAQASCEGPRGGQLLPVAAPLPERPEDYTAKDLREVLRNSFGHEEFRAGQSEAMLAVLGRKRTLLLLSTGCGKSLCYQIPAFLLREEGLTLVVSPLVSLMADQLLRLPSCLRGAIVTGQQTREQVRNVMRAVRARLVDVLFISPERLAMWAFDGCRLPPIALACVDEAHCVSQWSHNFRPDYLRIQDFLMNNLGAERLLALTATATRPTIRSTCDLLGLDVVVRSDRTFTPEELLQEPTQPRVQRTNLTMAVRCLGDEEEQVRELAKILRSDQHAKSPTIVYVWRKITADQLAKRLRVIIRGGVQSYHGSMMPDARKSVQDAFMTGFVRVVVATMAFGMGLDKPDIRLVVHFNLPKSIENYIQETGRGSRDGAPGHCMALLCPRDYKIMRWMESGGGASRGQAGPGLVRRLLAILLHEGEKGPHSRHDLGPDVAEDMAALRPSGRADATPAATPIDGQWQPYNVAFEEREMAQALGCQPDELHSMLAHFAHRASGHVVLFSHFPTKLKLRFFRTDPEELARQDPLIRKVLPFAKKTMGVHTLETAHVLAQLGGKPGDLSNALWQAQGDEFSVQKADVGYMVSVLQPNTEQQFESYVDQIVDVNLRARSTSIEKLDSVFIALSRAGGAGATPRGPAGIAKARAAAGESPADDGASADALLSGLIDSYFVADASDELSLAVASSREERASMLQNALGGEYRPAEDMLRCREQATAGGAGASSQSNGGVAQPASSRQPRDVAAVYATAARLVLGSDWPATATGDASSTAHAAAQFLAGISSTALPANKWRDHHCWGRFKNFGDFDSLESIVAGAVERVYKHRARREAEPAAPQPEAAPQQPAQH